MTRLALGWNAPRQPVLGMVLSGRVDAVGPGVSSFEAGDRVFGFNRHRFGTCAEYVCWPANGLLAPRPGHKVLVFGASGAVGTSAVQLARHLGADVTGVCSTTNVELVKSLGAARVVDYTDADFTQSAERYDLVFDAVGKNKSADALRRCKRVLVSGGRSISVDDGTPRLHRDHMWLLGELAAHGEINPVIDRTHALTDIVDAHAYVDRGHKRGNVIIGVA